VRTVQALLRACRVAAGAVVVALVLAGCASLPPPTGRIPSTAITETAQTRLGRGLAADLAEHPGASGVVTFFEPRDAFAGRMLLAGAAEKSLDVQYYIWHGDEVGILLFEALWKAAERGVRVRLLLDDANTGGLDPTIATLDAHPNIEVRLYNPFPGRGSRALGYLSDFERLNRRMHNKSFTVDNQVTVVGGRNIGNEYFGAGEGAAFVDLDAMVVGAAVAEVSAEFDLYWNSASAYPAAQIVGPAAPDGAAALERRFADTRADAGSVAYLDAVRASPLIAELSDRRLPFEWTSAEVLADDPAKTLDAAERTDILLFPELMRRMGRPERGLDIVSAYFVPGEHGTAALADLARSGIRVRILTNSLAASDVGVVHAGYAKRRKALLQAGVSIWELKPTVVERADASVGSSSSSGLHAKTYAVDGRRIFIGSFNFDPRSARLNTEMGVVVDSPAIAGRLARAFETVVPLAAYEVRLVEGGDDLEWIERLSDGSERRYTSEPETGAFKRFTVQLLSILPIDWLL
jgi:putative cardiolipin synthase